MNKLLLTLAAYSLFLTTVNAQTITTFAGNGTYGFNGDGGQATAAELNDLEGVSCDGSGNLYIADLLNYCVRTVNTSGVINAFAGIPGTVGFSGDGGQATAAELGHVAGVYVDALGNVFIGDDGNNRIRKVTASGIISTVAGNGTGGFSGDGGIATAAEISGPYDIITDGAGNIYFADFSNHRIRKINTSGIISTIAGNGTQGFSGDDGPATAAELNHPIGLTLNGSGNLIIADQNNNRVRELNGSGIISTICGTGVAATTGDGGQATAAAINWPAKPIVDAAGNIYISGYMGCNVRKINTSGIISTIAGTGGVGFSGDGGPATAACLANPQGICSDAAGNMYIADQGNRRVRKIVSAVVVTGINPVINNISCFLYPNPASDNITIQLSKAGKTVVTLYNITGREVLNTVKENGFSFTISVAEMPAGIYLLKLQSEDGNIITKKIEVTR
jgi:hypothetical protein